MMTLLELLCTDFLTPHLRGKWTMEISSNFSNTLGCSKITMQMEIISLMIQKWWMDKEIKFKWSLLTRNNTETMKKWKIGWEVTKISMLIWKNFALNLDIELLSKTSNRWVWVSMLFKQDYTKDLKIWD